MALAFGFSYFLCFWNSFFFAFNLPNCLTRIYVASTISYCQRQQPNPVLENMQKFLEKTLRSLAFLFLTMVSLTSKSVVTNIIFNVVLVSNEQSGGA